MAYEFYVSAQGAKQGKLKGETAGPGKRSKDRFPGVRFALEITSPRDPATGLPTGKRLHKPIVITKEWGAASPQLYQALVTNENLKTVLFEFVKTDASGREFVHYTVKLTDAQVADVRSYLDVTAATGHPYDGRELEDVSFVFRKIELTDVESKTSFVDDWATPAA